MDLTNVRAAYDEIVAEVTLEGISTTTIKKSVPLKQKIEDWQSSKTVSIAGYSQTVGKPDTVNWKGVPKAGGSCEIYFDEDGNVVFDWGGENAGKGRIPLILRIIQETLLKIPDCLTMN